MEHTEKYLIDGSVVELVETCQNGFLVHRLYEDGETGELISDDKIRWVEQVFDAAPTVKFSEEVLRLSGKVADLQRQISEQQASVSEGLARYTETMAKLKRHEQLRLLEDFLDGKITHYVICSWVPKIVPFESALCEFSPRGGTKLLALFGDSKGDLQWRINQYRDGSGTYRDAYPCTSEQQAKEVLAKWLANRFTAGEWNERYLVAAGTHDLEVPREWVESVRQQKIKEAQCSIEERRKELAASQESLAKLTKS